MDRDPAGGYKILDARKCSNGYLVTVDISSKADDLWRISIFHRRPASDNDDANKV